MDREGGALRRRCLMSDDTSLDSMGGSSWNDCQNVLAYAISSGEDPVNTARCGCWVRSTVLSAILFTLRRHLSSSERTEWRFEQFGDTVFRSILFAFIDIWYSCWWYDTLLRSFIQLYSSKFIFTNTKYNFLWASSFGSKLFFPEVGFSSKLPVENFNVLRREIIVVFATKTEVYTLGGCSYVHI